MNQRLGKYSFFWVCAILLSAILPYVYGKLKIEHIVVYSSFLICIAFTIAGVRRFQLEKKILGISALLFIAFAISLLANYFDKNNPHMGSFYGVLNNLLEAPVIFFVFSFIFPFLDDEQLYKALRFSVYIAALTGLYAILTIFINLNWLTTFFLGQPIENSLWAQVYSLGRYTGIFNQPMECGIFYSATIFSVFYLWVEKKITWFPFVITVFLIATGGLLCLSKSFVLIASILGICFLFFYAKTLYERIAVILFGSLFFGILFLRLISQEGYLNAYKDMFEQHGIIFAATAGRIAVGGHSPHNSVGDLFSQTLQNGFWTGFGMGSFVPLDNGFLQYFYQSGIFSLLCYLAVITIIFYIGIKNIKKTEGVLLFLLSIFIFGASIGGPVLTLNRANVPLIFLICFCIIRILRAKNIVNIPSEAKKPLQDTLAWRNLMAHAQEMRLTSLSQLFKANQHRKSEFSVSIHGLSLDYSRHLMTKDILDTFVKLLVISNLKEKTDAFWSGENINVTENTPAMHPLLRQIAQFDLNNNLSLYQDEIKITHQRMIDFANKVRSGEYCGATSERFTDIVHIGIGGSTLGSQLIIEALAPYHEEKIKVHFASTMDAAMLMPILQKLNPATTLIFMASKSFTTEETLLNGEVAKEWLHTHLGQHSGVDKHFLAATANYNKAAEFGIPTENIFPLGDWVSGRFSLWSAIGLSALLAVGSDNFNALLEGATEMDKHFKETDYLTNIPVILAILDVWYRNFFHTTSHAILPYSYLLRSFPNYLQQLEMESNGKSVTLDNEPVEYKTAPVIWGGYGTDSQHSFHQLLHQGTDMIPVDFLIAEESHYGDFQQKKLLAHCHAQADTLMQGCDDSVPYKKLVGNRPSTIIKLSKITPFNLGLLLAAYEHKVFVQSVIWRINCFDQWGVEFAKVVARGIYTQETSKC
ncbi:MAG: glucose-6-phosphate isomerase [Legionellales bacterium]|nr:glucose-6-phosphate isomerase [Legionellales bacterium]